MTHRIRVRDEPKALAGEHDVVSHAAVLLKVGEKPHLNANAQLDPGALAAAPTTGVAAVPLPGRLGQDRLQRAWGPRQPGRRAPRADRHHGRHARRSHSRPHEGRRGRTIRLRDLLLLHHHHRRRRRRCSRRSRHRRRHHCDMDQPQSCHRHCRRSRAGEGAAAAQVASPRNPLAWAAEGSGSWRSSFSPENTVVAEVTRGQ